MHLLPISKDPAFPHSTHNVGYRFADRSDDQDTPPFRAPWVTGAVTFQVVLLASGHRPRRGREETVGWNVGAISWNISSALTGTSRR